MVVGVVVVVAGVVVVVERGECSRWVGDGYEELVILEDWWWCCCCGYCCCCCCWCGRVEVARLVDVVGFTRQERKTVVEEDGGMAEDEEVVQEGPMVETEEGGRVLPRLLYCPADPLGKKPSEWRPRRASVGGRR